MPAGRPTKYKEDYNHFAYRHCLLGATNDDLAKLFDVNVDTIYEWQNKYEKFSDAIKKGKAQADGWIANSLFNRALGYTHQEEKIFQNNGEIIRADTTKHYPPETAACIFWLKNRQPDKWRDKQEIAVEDRTIRVALPQQEMAKDDDDFQRIVKEQLGDKS